MHFLQANWADFWNMHVSFAVLSGGTGFLQGHCYIACTPFLAWHHDAKK